MKKTIKATLISLILLASFSSSATPLELFKSLEASATSSNPTVEARATYVVIIAMYCNAKDGSNFEHKIAFKKAVIETIKDADKWTMEEVIKNDSVKSYLNKTIGFKNCSKWGDILISRNKLMTYSDS